MIKKSQKIAQKKLINQLGWLGVAALLIAHILMSSGILLGASYSYQLLSLVGCSLIAFEAWHKKDNQPATLNVIFACVSIYAIIRLALLR